MAERAGYARLTKAEGRQQRKLEKRAAELAAGLDDLQRAEVYHSSHQSGAGFLVDRRKRLPRDMVAPYSGGWERLTDPLGLAVRALVQEKENV